MLDSRDGSFEALTRRSQAATWGHTSQLLLLLPRAPGSGAMLAGKGWGTARPSVPLRQSGALPCLRGRAQTRAPFTVNAPRGCRGNRAGSWRRQGARPARRAGRARMLLPRCPAWVAEARGGGRRRLPRKESRLNPGVGAPFPPPRGCEDPGILPRQWHRPGRQEAGADGRARRHAGGARVRAAALRPRAERRGRAARVPALPLRVLEGGPRVFLRTEIFPGTVLLRCPQAGRPYRFKSLFSAFSLWYCGDFSFKKKQVVVMCKLSCAAKKVSQFKKRSPIR